LITSILSKSKNSKNLKIIKIPSISINDFYFEIKENKRLKNNTSFLSYVLFFLLFPLGLILDLLQLILLKRNGEGRWSWSLSSLIVIPNLINKKFNFIFSTGGPACSHILAILLSKIIKTKCVCELQDPLVGRDIGRESSSKFLKLVEVLLVKYCYKLIFVTKTAGKEAIKRYKKDNIKSIYPGAKKIISNQLTFYKGKQLGPIKIVHVGTLYTNRNLNNLIKAVDQLLAERKIKLNTFEITNIGEIYGDIKQKHLSKYYIKKLPITNRTEALKQSLNYDYCMLVQHTDDRSKTTIPFKFYDYLNLNKSVIGIINNGELTTIFKKNGFMFADANSIDKIKKMLINIKNFPSKKTLNLNKLKLDHITQTNKIFDE